METIQETLQLTIKSSILDRTRQLTISRTYLEFDDRSSVGSEPTRFLKEEIEGFRYGVKAIHGYQFVIGRIYCIDINNTKGKIIKIRLKSLYGVRKNELGEKYISIINALLEYFFDDIAQSFLQQFAKNESFSILGVNFNSQGVRLKKNNQSITWDDLDTKSFISYFALFSKANPNLYWAFEYLNDWNTTILEGVSRQILNEKNLSRES
jgi:hypothetical protein